jgi:hypothetical protein
MIRSKDELTEAVQEAAEAMKRLTVTGEDHNGAWAGSGILGELAEAITGAGEDIRAGLEHLAEAIRERKANDAGTF